MCISVFIICLVWSLKTFFSFVENKADLGETDVDNAITCAVENNEVDCLQILLDLNIWEKALLSTVSKYEDFLPSNVSEDEVKSLVSLAVDNNCPECLDLLIKYKAFIEPTDPKHGYTPVFFATVMGHAECLDLLLTAGASIIFHKHSRNCRRRPGCTVPVPIHTAAGLGHVECLKVLLNHLSDSDQKQRKNMLEFRGNYQETAFWRAAYHRQTECMKILLEAGASPFFQIGNDEASYDMLPFPDVPFTSIGAVLHHLHVCKRCKLEEIYHSGKLDEPFQDYTEYQPQNDSKICFYCKTDTCDCDSLENSLEIFSVENMRKFIGKIKRMSIDAIVCLLNEGMSESIHLVRPEQLRLTLKLGADPHQYINFRYDQRRHDRIQYNLGISVTTILDRLVCQDVQQKPFQFDNSLVISAISFLQWIAIYNRSPPHLKKATLECLQVFMDYHKSYDQLAVKPKYSRLNIGEKALLHLAGSTWFAGLKLVVESGLVDINCRLDHEQITNTPIINAAMFHYMPTEKVKLLLLHGAAAQWIPNDRINHNFPPGFSVMLEEDEVMKLISLLVAAGFPKHEVSCLIEHLQFYQSPTTPEERKDKIDKYIEDLMHSLSLLNQCRYAIAEHLMAANPNSNMFHLVPRLPLPTILKDLLLYSINLTPLPDSDPDQDGSSDSESESSSSSSSGSSRDDPDGELGSDDRPDYEPRSPSYSPPSSPDSVSALYPQYSNPSSSLQIYFQGSEAVSLGNV